MKHLTLGIVYVVLVASLVGARPVAAASSVTVFAAASLKEAMDAQAVRFERSTGDRVVVSYGASNALARQIEAGAPADIFVSADLDWMDYLDKLHLIEPGSRIDLLHNALVLIEPTGAAAKLAIGPHFGLAAALHGGRLAMANPDAVPAGRYGKEALVHLGVWADVERRIAPAENVRAALALVSRGEAPLGIVYRTDAMADPGVKIVGTFPPGSHAPIVYPAALVAGSTSAAARTLLDDLHSAAAQVVWTRYGFALAHR